MAGRRGEDEEAEVGNFPSFFVLPGGGGARCWPPLCYGRNFPFSPHIAEEASCGDLGFLGVIAMLSRLSACHHWWRGWPPSRRGGGGGGEAEEDGENMIRWPAGVRYDKEKTKSISDTEARSSTRSTEMSEGSPGMERAM